MKRALAWIGTVAAWLFVFAVLYATTDDHINPPLPLLAILALAAVALALFWFCGRPYYLPRRG